MPVTAAQLAQLSHDQRRSALEGMSAADLAALEWHWPFWARRDQLPPEGEWRTFLLLGGRGSGKTRSSSEWIRAEMESGRRRQVGIIGPTADAVRRIMIEGPSGILSVCPPWNRPSYEPSTRKIVWPNGAIAYAFSAEEPDRLRGPNFDAHWCDEITSWANAPDVWDMLQMALRIPGPQGHAPCGVVSTTPKNQPLLKQIMTAPSTVITRAKTSDNASNLDASTLQYLNDKYGGTRLGRQELDAELLQDLEGALWSRTLLDATRIRRADAPDMRRIVVAIDPPGGSARSNAECGIVVAGIGPDRHGYVLADLSGRMSPEKWARTAVNAYHGWRADRIVAEQNFGGAMVESTIKSVDPLVPIRMVVASRGKQIRAEPIAALYEQHRVHHVSEFPSTGGPNDRMGPGGIWSITRSRRRTYVGVHRTDVRSGPYEDQPGISGRRRHSRARHLWLVPAPWAVMRVIWCRFSNPKTSLDATSSPASPAFKDGIGATLRPTLPHQNGASSPACDRKKSCQQHGWWGSVWEDLRGYSLATQPPGVLIKPLEGQPDPVGAGGLEVAEEEAGQSAAPR